MYTPNVGFVKRTRAEMIDVVYKRFVELTQAPMSREEFEASNMHMVCNIFFEIIETQDDTIMLLLAKLTDYWQKANEAIKGSLGAAKEGWQQVFANLCTGVDVVNSQTDSALAAGEIGIYFDNLTASPDELETALKKCINVAEYTQRGNNEIVLTFSNKQTQKVQYYNLKPEDYTTIDINIVVEYSRGAAFLPDDAFTNHFLTRYDETNRIHKDFLPDSYMDPQEFEGVAALVVYSRLPGAEWTRARRLCLLGNKFVIGDIFVEARA